MYQYWYTDLLVVSKHLVYKNVKNNGLYCTLLDGSAPDDPNDLKYDGSCL